MKNIPWKLRQLYYNVASFFRNIPFFLKMAWKFRSWDSTYNIELFAESLKLTANKIKKNNHTSDTKQVYRRTITMVGMLRKAYLENSVDKTQLYLMNKNGYKFTKHSSCGYYSMDREYVTDKRIYEGMYKASMEREKVAQAQKEKEVWAYIGKYIKYIWD